MEATGAVREGAGQLRLMELLEGFVGERGRTEATKVPGVNYKTLAGAIEGEGAAQAEARQETQRAAAEKRRDEGPAASLTP